MVRKISKTFKSIKKRYQTRHRAISPVVSTLLIFALIITGVTIGFLQIIPFIEQSKVESSVTSVQTGLIKAENSVYDLLAEGGGRREIEINKPMGQMTLNTLQDYIHIKVTDDTDTTYVNGTTSFSLSNTSGQIQYSLSTTYDIIPDGDFEYLSGTNVKSARDPVSIIDPVYTDERDYLGSNNLIMTREGTSINLDLFFRPKIIVTINDDGSSSEINIQVQRILLRWNQEGKPSGDFIGLTSGNMLLGLTYSSSDVSIISEVSAPISANDQVYLKFQNSGSLATADDNEWQELYWTALNNGIVSFSSVTHIVDVISYI